MLQITALYAAPLALLFVALSIRVIAVRRSESVPLGDGGNKILNRRIRAQGNCAEYAPLGLILLAVAEMNGGPAWALHLLGASLLLGRVLHGAALSRDTPWPTARVAGMLLTFAMLILGALLLLGQALT